MKKSNRLFSLVISVVIVLSTVLTGCGSKETQDVSPKDTSAQATTTQEVAPKLDPVKLTWVFPGTAQPDQALIEQKLDEYMKDKINASITLSPIDWGIWGDQQNILIASGSDMDIMFTAYWCNYAQNVSKGAFVDITPYWDSYLSGTKKAIDPLFISNTTVNGKNYAVATNKEVGLASAWMARKDILEKYKIDVSKIKLVTDITSILKTVHENEAGMSAIWPEPVPIILGENIPGTIVIGDADLPGVYDEATNKVVDQFDNFPYYLDQTKLIHEWYKAGYVLKEIATTKQSQQEMMKAGKLFSAMGVAHPGKVGQLKMQTGVDWEVVQLGPVGVNQGTTQGSMQAISTNSKNPERAAMFLELVNTDAFVNNTINFGIENVHYKKTAPTVIDYADGVTSTTSKYNPASSWEFGNQFLNYTWTFEPVNQWDLYKEFNTKARISNISGFTFDNEPVKNEIAACLNVQNELFKGIQYGMLDPDVYMPKISAKFKANGSDKIVAEKQKQLDAWFKANGK